VIVATGIGLPVHSVLPPWVTKVGWACVIGSAAFAAAVRYEISTLPEWEVRAGFIDFFFPGPRAIAMLLWELAHVWVVFVAVALVISTTRGRSPTSRDWLLVISLLAGLLSGGILVGELTAKGVDIGVPGVDHHWRQWF